MADFTLTQPGGTLNPWIPAGILVLNGSTLQVDSVGWRPSGGSYTPYAHNVAYGSVITATITWSAVSEFDEAYVGVVVRTGANAGAFIGLYLSGGTTAALRTATSTGTLTDFAGSGSISIPAPVPGDVFSITLTNNGTSWTASNVFQNATALTGFGSLSTTTYVSEASAAAGSVMNPGNVNGSKLSQFTGTGVSISSAVAVRSVSGPGISPDKRTMLSSRPLSAFIAPNSLGGGIASWQSGGFGQLTGVMAAPIIGLRREFGPGPGPDYVRAFQRPALATNTPIIAAMTGVASWQGGGYGNIVATASIQGLASWQGAGGAGSLIGVGALSGLASWQGAGFGNIGSGAITNITGVASWQGSSLGAMSGAGALTGVAGGQATARGPMTGAGVLTGTASWQGFGYGAAGALGVLTGIASWQSSAMGILLGAGQLQGRANAEGHTVGILLGDGALGGLASWSSGAYGAVKGVGTLEGLASGQGGALGTMEGAAQLAGLASWQGFAQGLALPAGAGQMHGLAAAFSYAYGSMSGSGHTFGYAQVVALSQTGLPVARGCYIEGSSCVITAAYFDRNGIPFVPNAVQYRIDDVTSDSNIVPWTSTTPEFVNAVTITSTENAMVSFTRSSEPHQVLFQITDSAGNSYYADVVFDLIRVAGLA